MFSNVKITYKGYVYKIIEGSAKARKTPDHLRRHAREHAAQYEIDERLDPDGDGFKWSCASEIDAYAAHDEAKRLVIDYLRDHGVQV